MNYKIPLNSRLLGALLHTIGAVPALLTSLGILWILLFSRNISSPQFVIVACMYIAYSYIPIIIFSALTISIFTRKEKRLVRAFISAVGKDAVNYSLNCIVWVVYSVIITGFIFGITCGGVFIAVLTQTMILYCLLPVAIISIAYTINSVIAIIFTLRGARFKSSLLFLPGFR